MIRLWCHKCRWPAFLGCPGRRFHAQFADVWFRLSEIRAFLRETTANGFDRAAMEQARAEYEAEGDAHHAEATR